MRTVHVTRTIPAPAEDVFDLLADHANYDRFRAIHGSELIREGDPAPNGVGALRRIRVRPLTFQHDGGSITFALDGDATRVDWRSSFSVPTPVVGGLQETVWQPVLTRGFRRVLEDVERMLADR